MQRVQTNFDDPMDYVTSYYSSRGIDEGMDWQCDLVKAYCGMFLEFSPPQPRAKIHLSRGS